MWHSEKHFNFQEKPEVCSLYPVALYLGSPRLLSLVPLTLALFYTNLLHKRQKNGQIISCFAKINVRPGLSQVLSFASAVTVCISLPGDLNCDGKRVRQYRNCLTVIEQMLPKNNPPLFSLKFITPSLEEVYAICYSWRYCSFHHK